MAALGHQPLFVAVGARVEAFQELTPVEGDRFVQALFSLLPLQQRLEAQCIDSDMSRFEQYMFLVGDQPYLNSPTINKLVHVFKKEKPLIVAPLYKGQRGNPVIFSSKLKRDLLKIEGDHGGSTIIEKMMNRVRFVAIEKSIVGIDIDTEEAYTEIHTRSVQNQDP